MDEVNVMAGKDEVNLSTPLVELNARIFAAEANSTHRAYARDIRVFTHWYLQVYGAPATLTALSVDVLTRYRNDCVMRMSAGTFNRRRTALNHLCIWAVARGLLDDNPLSHVPCGKWK